jgi:hypothetical protein
MNKVALLIVFNHNYEKNIDALLDIYQNRFSNIYFVIPFYKGDRKDVIKVFDNSYYFHGFVAYAIDRIKDLGFQYYFTVADDLFLNPKINENNFEEIFKLDEDSAFVPHPFLLTDLNETKPSRPFAPFWNGISLALKFKLNQNGINIKEILPSFSEAENILKQHGYNFVAKLPKRIFFSKPILKKTNSKHNDTIRTLIHVLGNLKYLFKNNQLDYPLIGSYSDIIIVSNNNVNKFIDFSGAFAALNLFVEIAMPTAVFLAYPKIISEKNLRLKGETYWYYNHHECEAKYKKSINYLKINFDPNSLYVHPIKLSKWG